MDYRALNEAVWNYSEWIRELEANPKVFCLIDVRLFLECARASEKEDMVPAFDFSDAEAYAADTLRSVSELLHIAASGSAA